MDEEAQKRNTDCVYFLASPLTCKKGIHCEFRHSEAARFNPRDCWYWLSGNCLNANCSFRHPPLDGKPTSVSASAPAPSKAASLPSMAATSSPMPANKSRTQCYFFSQGFCTKGDRCAFLHGGPRLSVSTQAVDAQKPSTCNGVETNDKPTIVVVTNGPNMKKHMSQDVKPGALVTPVHPLPSNVYIRAKETSCISDDTARARTFGVFRTSLSSKHQSTHTPSIKKQNSADLHDGQQSVKQQRQIRDKPQLELIRCAEARQQQTFSDEERTQNESWMNGTLKEASPGLADESDNSVYGEDLPYPVANTHFMKRSFPCNDTHDFRPYDQDHPRFYNTPLTSEQDIYECFDLLYEYDDQHSYPSSKGRHRSRFYARRDRHRIKGDLRDRLGKHRHHFRYQVSDINGYNDCFQDMDDHATGNERGWDGCLDWAASGRDRDIYKRRLEGAGHGSVHMPSHGFRLDIGEDNASSGSSPKRFSVNSYQGSTYINVAGISYGSRRARKYSKLEFSDLGAQHRLAQANVESETYADHCLQTQAADTLRSEIHSSSYSGFVKRPFIKSRVLPASSSDEVGLRGSTSNDFEGPKPLSILLQHNRKVNEDRGETSVQQAGFDREEHVNGVRNYSNRFCLEKVNIAARKRKQGDSFGNC